MFKVKKKMLAQFLKDKNSERCKCVFYTIIQVKSGIVIILNCFIINDKLRFNTCNHKRIHIYKVSILHM